MKTMSKLVYFAIALIISSNVILNYSTMNEETGIILFQLKDFQWEVFPIVHQSANFVSSVLDTGLLIVLLTLQKVQNSRHLRDTSSLETKLNTVLAAQAESLMSNKKEIERSPYVSEQEKQTRMKSLDTIILSCIKESTTIINPDMLSIPDLISKKSLQKENFDMMLKSAIKEQDKALVAYLTPLVITLGKEILGLTKQV